MKQQEIMPAEIVFRTDTPAYRAELLASRLEEKLNATIVPHDELDGQWWVGFRVIDFNARVVYEILEAAGFTPDKYEVKLLSDDAIEDHGDAWHSHGHPGHMHGTGAHDREHVDHLPVSATILIPVLSSVNKPFKMSEVCAELDVIGMIQSQEFEGVHHYVLEVSDFNAHLVDRTLQLYGITEYTVSAQDVIDIAELEFVPNGALGAPDGEPSENARMTGAGNLLQSQ